MRTEADAEAFRVLTLFLAVREEATALGVVRDWVNLERSEGVPAGILELRNRLADDLGFVT